MFSILFNLFIAAWGIFFFVLILSTPHGRPLAKCMLLVFVVTQTMTPLVGGAQLSGEQSRDFIHYIYNLFYLSGPAFYFYIKSLRQPTFHFDLRSLWHFSPVIIIPLLSYTLLFRFEATLPADGIHLLIMLVWFIGYLVAALRLLPSRRWLSRELFVPESDAIWRWLYIPTVFYIATYALRVGYMCLEIAHLLPAMKPDIAYILTMSARAIFFYLVAIGGYRHRYVHELREEETESPISNEEGGVKYRKSSLNDEQIQDIWRKLHQYMSDKRPFLDSALKLAQIARALGISVSNLSQVINTCAGQSFHEFINGYRAREAQKLIKQHASSDKSMMDLSLEAGFGNSATFYKYFKKYLSVTPSQYRKSCQNQ